VVAKRVLLLYQDSLLAQGVLSLLGEEARLAVAEKRLNDGDIAQFVEEFGPDVIVIDRDDFAKYAPIGLDQLLRGRSDVKVVDISSQDDLARVYQRYQIHVAKFDDLLTALSGDES